MSLNRFLCPSRVLVTCVSCAKSTCRGKPFSYSGQPSGVGSVLLLPLDYSCVGLYEDTGIGAAMFPYPSEAISPGSSDDLNM